MLHRTVVCTCIISASVSLPDISTTVLFHEKFRAATVSVPDRYEDINKFVFNVSSGTTRVSSTSRFITTVADILDLDISDCRLANNVDEMMDAMKITATSDAIITSTNVNPRRRFEVHFFMYGS